ncbi:MAG TPA: efflux RND transporter periplasmic adaptor subunit [Blastocatellia bacterium]
MTWIRIAFLIAALGVAGVIGAIALRPSPVSVEVERVGCGPMRVTVDAEGKTRARDRFVVAAPVSGRLARINLRRGDAVKRDEVIARIDPLPMAPLDPRQLAETKARVAAAEQLKHEADAVVEQALADCEQAGRERSRAEKLIETGDVSRQDFERVRNAALTCKQQIEAAKYRAHAAGSEVEVAKAALIAVEQAGQSGVSATVFVRAPVSGRVLRVIEESERVAPAGAPLVELSNPSLEVVIETLSADAVKVKPGNTVMIEGWGGEQELEARVRLIEPSAFTKISALGVEEQRVNIIADFIEPDTPLGDGYRVEARVVIWETKEALKAPLSALFRSGQNWSAFVLENGLAKRREVETGHRADFEVEVLSGLREGESVIAHPSNLVTDGVRVSAGQK